MPSNDGTVGFSNGQNVLLRRPAYTAYGLVGVSFSQIDWHVRDLLVVLLRQKP